MIRSVRWRWLRTYLQGQFRSWHVSLSPKESAALQGLNVLVLGIYLGDRFNLASHLRERYADGAGMHVEQRWAAINGVSSDPELARLTTLRVSESTPKFELINALCTPEELASFDYVVISDDDVWMPKGFFGKYIATQRLLRMDLAQPSRALHSFYDHKFTVRRPWLVARETRFVEIGPVFSMNARAVSAMTPFDVRFPMGWGLDLVWPACMNDMSLGIIDRVSIDHSYRGQGITYDRSSSIEEMNRLLGNVAHVPIAQAQVAVKRISRGAGSLPFNWLKEIRQAISVWNRKRILKRRSSNRNYLKWIARHDVLDAGKKAQILGQIRALDAPPLISVVMPVFNPKPEYLVQAIESVQRQLYRNWELCIADDRSTDPAVRAVLKKYEGLDPRVKITYRAENGHISRASNTALAMATGVYVAMVDHDDILREHALARMALAVTAHPDGMVFYSDEDKIDSDGKRSQPYFKPEWNEYFLRSHNMMCHLSLFRRSLVDEVGGFREGYEGAQDYDLALRCIESCRPSQIVHVPEILYHWRLHEQSTAAHHGAKPYALDAGKRALQEHLRRRQINGFVRVINGRYDIEYVSDALAQEARQVTERHRSAHQPSWQARINERS